MKYESYICTVAALVSHTCSPSSLLSFLLQLRYSLEVPPTFGVYLLEVLPSFWGVTSFTLSAVELTHPIFTPQLFFR